MNNRVTPKIGWARRTSQALRQAPDRLLRFMFDLKPGESAFVCGMGMGADFTRTLTSFEMDQARAYETEIKRSLSKDDARDKDYTPAQRPFTYDPQDKEELLSRGANKDYACFGIIEKRWLIDVILHASLSPEDVYCAYFILKGETKKILSRRNFGQITARDVAIALLKLERTDELFTFVKDHGITHFLEEQAVAQRLAELKVSPPISTPKAPNEQQLRLLIRYCLLEGLNNKGQTLIEAAMALEESTVKAICAEEHQDTRTRLLLQTGLALRKTGQPDAIKEIYREMRESGSVAFSCFWLNAIYALENEHPTKVSLANLWQKLIAVILDRKGKPDEADLLICRYFLLKGAKNTVALQQRIDSDPNFNLLLPGLARAAHADSSIFLVAHLCQSLDDVKFIQQQPKDRQQLIAKLNHEKDPRRVIILFRLIEAQQAGMGLPPRWQPRQAVFFMPGMFGNHDDYIKAAMKVAQLLRIRKLPGELIDEVVAIGLDAVEKRMPYLLEGDQDPLAIPEKVRKIAREVASQAYKARELVRTVARETQKPTFTVYILTTGDGLDAEKPLMKQRAEFARQVGVELKAAGSTDLELIQMQVGARWLAAGKIDHFSLSVKIKIPSGSSPSEESRARVLKLAQLAAQNNWDILFVDHSTVRTKNAVHRGDPEQFENGRAIARAMAIVKEILGQQANFGWLYKGNNWDSSVLALAKQQPNVTGINLYDGRVYKERVGGGRKADWLQIDDRRTLFFGGTRVAQADLPQEQAADLSPPIEGFAIERADKGYRFHMIVDVYWQAFWKEIERLESLEWGVAFSASNILFVCNINHHRSVAAEILLTERLKVKFGNAAQDVKVSSAGLAVEKHLEKNPGKENMSHRVRKKLKKHGLTPPQIRKRQISKQMADEAELIVVMTKREKDVILRRFPHIHPDKVAMLKRYAGFPEEEQDLSTNDFLQLNMAGFEEIIDRFIGKLTRP